MNRLRQVRLSKGMNQKELAEALNLSQAAISGYETGKYDPGMKIWKSIAEYFGVSVDYLIEDVPEEKTKNPADNVSEAKREMMALVDRLSDDQVRKLLQIANAALEL